MWETAVSDLMEVQSVHCEKQRTHIKSHEHRKFGSYSSAHGFIKHQSPRMPGM